MTTRYMPIETGTYTVTADDETAGTLDITLPYDPTGAIVQVYDATGNQLENPSVTLGTEKITVATNGTDYVVTQNQVIHYIIF